MTLLPEEALDLLEVAVLLADAELRIEYANARAATGFGVEVGGRVPDAFRGDGWPDWDRVATLAHEDGWHHCDARDDRGRPARIFARARSGGGILVEVRLALGAEDDGRFGEALDDGFIDVLDRADVGLWRSDPVTDELWWSTGSYRLLDQDPGPVSIENYMQRVPEEDQALIAERMNACVVKDEPYDPHFRIVRRDGETRHVFSTGKVVRRPDGTALAYVGTVVDETELVRARQRIEDLREQLEQAQRLGITGQLATGVAHDLNNVLTAILGQAELLEVDGLDEESRQSVAEIIAAGEHAANLAGHLLALGRQSSLRLRTVELSTLVRTSLRVIRRLVPEQVDLRMSAEAATEGCWVRADATRIEQILFNLVINAVHAVGPRGRIEVGVRADADGVQLWVRDDGVGMAPEVVERIFEPFFTTRGQEGSGLGLSSVQGIVEQHGGRMNVTSAPGEGSTFTVRLPAGTPGLTQDVTVVPARGGRAPVGGVKVLVVEDQRFVRIVAAQILRRAGYEVQMCNHPEEALETIRGGWIPDLLLSDVVMPQMSGPELVAALEPEHPDLRVLFISGYPKPLLDEQGVLDERVPLLAKPFTREALLAAVREVLS